MGRDKSKDDKFFNCSQEHELKYVASLYVESDKVYQLLVARCKDGTIKYWTHLQVYQLIQRELGYAIP